MWVLGNREHNAIHGPYHHYHRAAKLGNYMEYLETVLMPESPTGDNLAEPQVPEERKLA